MKTKQLSAYTLLKKQDLPDIHATGFHYKHEKSGAEVVYLKTDDKNKVFTITFKTIPTDDTGVAHILEHAVLGGSRKYTAKDPFAEMLKGSLASFINAFTFRDKTMYPIASTNWQDFKNLTDLYLDSVFFPRLSRETFAQEGWHYTFDNDQLGIKGVVFNEMKGAFSNPDEVVEETITSALFPDTIYRHISGGHPTAIPDLTYEQFVTFHKTYYHPSNARIFIAGDLPHEELLAYIDTDYLSHFDAQEITADIPLQPKNESIQDITVPYPIAADESPEQKTYLTKSFLLGKTTNVLDNLGFTVLCTVLSGLDNSPLRRALLESNLGMELYGGSYLNHFQQGTYSIGLEGSEAEHLEKFNTIMRDTFAQIVEKGFDKKTLEAALNTLEFSLREADFGNYPKGLVYAIESMQTWLHGEDPFEPLTFSDELQVLREKITTDYFEQLLKTHFIDNTHTVTVVATPDQTLEQNQEKATSEKLIALQASLSEDNLDSIKKHAKKIEILQNTPNTLEQLATLPILDPSEVESTQKETDIQVSNHDKYTLITHNITTNGIVYLDMLYDISHFSTEQLQYAQLLTELLTILPTEKYSMAELETEIMMHTGDISASLTTAIPKGSTIPAVYLQISGKALSHKIEALTHLIEEIVHATNFDQPAKIAEVLKSLTQQTRTSIITSGHNYSVTRALAQQSQQALIGELIGGISWYRFCSELSKSSDLQQTIQKLSDLQSQLKQSACILHVTADTELHPAVEKACAALTKVQTPQAHTTSPLALMAKNNEAFTVPSQVQYVTLAGALPDSADKQKGTLAVLKTLIDIDYLWQEVRIKGGAYGGFSSFTPFQLLWAFASYRDPNLDKTITTFVHSPEYIRSTSFSDQDVDKAIIGAVRTLDAPKTPRQEGAIALKEYLNGITHQDKQAYRTQILTSKPEQLKKLAAVFDQFVKTASRVVVGSQSALTASGEKWSVVSLFQ